MFLILPVIFHPYGGKNRSDLHKILHWADIQDVITGANLGDDQLISSHFCGGDGSNFRLFHRLSQSSLQHSRTTVRVCDKLLYPSIRDRTAPPVSVRVMVRVSVSFSVMEVYLNVSQ